MDLQKRGREGPWRWSRPAKETKGGVREREVGLLPWTMEGGQNKSDMHTRAPSAGGRLRGETERVELESGK